MQSSPWNAKRARTEAEGRVRAVFTGVKTSSPWNAKRARTEAEGQVRAVSTGVKTSSPWNAKRARTEAEAQVRAVSTGVKTIGLALSCAMVVGCGAGPIPGTTGPTPTTQFGDGDGDSDTESSGDGDGDGDGGDGDGDGDGGSVHATDGTYLLAIETTLGPDLPLVFIATVDLELADDGVTWLADFRLQPLSLEQGSNTPGDPVGEPLEYLDVVVIDDSFDLDLGLVMISGEANPVTGSDIELIGALLGQFVSADAWCGQLEGMLVSPLEYDLFGSSFAAIRIQDTSPEALPVNYPYRCEHLP